MAPTNTSSSPTATVREARYDPAEIEPRWQQRWDERTRPVSRRAAQPAASPSITCWKCCPIPPGQLHMGHVRNYSIGDALARYMWMQGYNVLHPMGWDAFGLPAENAALKNNTPPREWTLQNIAAMRRQMRRLGLSYDWETRSHHLPARLLPLDAVVLPAHVGARPRLSQAEQGELVPACAPPCWPMSRSSMAAAGVTKTPWSSSAIWSSGSCAPPNTRRSCSTGWTSLPGWPEKVRTMQRNWIGRSEGATIEFTLDTEPEERSDGKVRAAGARRIFAGNRDGRGCGKDPRLHHPRGHHLRRHQPAACAAASAWSSSSPRPTSAWPNEVAPLVEEQKKAREAGDPGAIEKHGVFTGHYAINPFSGERVPIWVANYILLEYGTGAVMSVPAHDERDYEFAKKYGLEMQRRGVAAPQRRAPAPGQPDEPVLPVRRRRQPADQLRRLQRPGLPGSAGEDGGVRPAAWFWQVHGHVSPERLGRQPPALLGRADSRALLRQGRHRARARRSVARPASRQIEITQQDGSPLSRVPSFVNATCPKCGGPARRETDTMDTFVDSSWYFYRYPDAHNAYRALQPGRRLTTGFPSISTSAAWSTPFST